MKRKNPETYPHKDAQLIFDKDAKVINGTKSAGGIIHPQAKI